MSIEVSRISSPEGRALRSGGISNDAVYSMVERALATRNISGDSIADVGCGVGNLYSYVRSRFKNYIGVDIVKYPDFPEDAHFAQANLDDSGALLAGRLVDVVIAVETIEHLENPREFMRKLTRGVRADGWVVVTTPNQLSLLSLAVLLIKHRFAAFQDVHYPAHLTALLEIDLLRIARECELEECAIEYSCSGRIPLTPWHYPRYLSRHFPRALSENVLVIGRKKATE